MPLYLYENEQTGEVVEVLQGMNDLHEYRGSNGREKGLWRRVYVNPTLSSDTKVDFGDLFDRSKEASEMRASKNGGRDPVKEKHYAAYNKKTNGKLHPEQQKEKFKNALNKADKAGIKIEL